MTQFRYYPGRDRKWALVFSSKELKVIDRYIDKMDRLWKQASWPKNRMELEIFFKFALKQSYAVKINKFNLQLLKNSYIFNEYESYSHELNS